MSRGQRGEEFNGLSWSTSTREAEKEGRECQGPSSLVEIREQIKRGLEVVAPREVVDKKREGGVGRAEGFVANEVAEEFVGGTSGGGGRREREDVAKERMAEGDVGVVEVQVGIEIEGRRRRRGGGELFQVGGDRASKIGGRCRGGCSGGGGEKVREGEEGWRRGKWGRGEEALEVVAEMGGAPPHFRS